MELAARGLTLAYGRRVAVDSVDLTIPSGELVVLAGPNGSGKSTLLRGLARLLRPRSGTVLLDGRPLARWPAAELARALAVLPQAPQSPGDLTVEQLVLLGRHPHQGFLALPSAADRAAVADALAQTDMLGLAGRPLTDLSGGERQRAWIALTLAQEPRVLLLDEPTTYLDPGHALAVLELLHRLHQARGISVVMALHDLSQALRYGDRVVLMHGGRIAAEGPPESVLTPEAVRRVFGIEVELVRTAGGLPALVPVRQALAATDPAVV